MKKLILGVALMMAVLPLTAQEVFKEVKDEFTGETNYRNIDYATHAKKTAGGRNQVIAFVLQPSRGSISVMGIQSDGFGCMDKTTVTFKMSNGEFVELTSIAKFNCDGFSAFLIGVEERYLLATEKVEMIRFNNNNNVMTIDFKDPTYFKRAFDEAKYIK